MKKVDFRGATVIVTGASSGIGKSIAKRLIEKYDSKIIAIARGEDKLLATKSELGDKGENYIPYPMDVTVLENWRMLADFFKKNDTFPLVLINCAGALPKFERFESVDIEKARAAFDLNFYSVLYSVKEIAPLLPKGGAIANISSASALCPFGMVSMYSASKAACERFSESISCEYKDISVSTVMPGFVRTDIMKNQEINEKDRGLINLFSAKSDKVAKKIVNKIRKRRRRIITGKDAHFMNFMFKFFPRKAPRIISWFLKKSGIEMFK